MKKWFYALTKLFLFFSAEIKIYLELIQQYLQEQQWLSDDKSNQADNCDS